jgi:hypothetical protein
MPSSWGGARPGAGRPPRGSPSSAPHKPRPGVAPGHAVRVTARVVRAVGSLRSRAARVAIEHALALSRARIDFRIVRLEIERSRLELIVQATDRIALARGMQGFCIAAARHLNRALGRRGTVFPDRYLR